MFVYTVQDVASLIAIGIFAIIIILGVVIYKIQNWYDGYSKRHGKSCDYCYWCQISMTGKKLYKCKLMPKKRFNKRKLHGWFCKFRKGEDEDEKSN